MRRTATAIWNGTGLEGSGTPTTPSGVLAKQPYSTKMRFMSEDGRAGTNPEELVAAAHAGCFAMALSFQLTGAGFTPDELKVDAVMSMAQEGVDWSISGVTLRLTAKVPNISQEKFLELANNAKVGCPISKALASVPITLEATLT